MYFLVKASPSKALDAATSNFLQVHGSHDVEGTGQRPKVKKYIFV